MVKVQTIFQQALEEKLSGVTQRWRPADHDLSGSVTPVATFRLQSGTYCRQYIQQVNWANEENIFYGPACRTPTGEWEIPRRRTVWAADSIPGMRALHISTYREPQLTPVKCRNVKGFPTYRKGQVSIAAGGFQLVYLLSHVRYSIFEIRDLMQNVIALALGIV